MKKLYDTNELRFSLIWIVIYIVLFSVADNVSEVIGISKIMTVPVSVLMTIIIYCWICKNGLKEKYGLYKFQGNIRQYLYFIPLVLLASTNLWFGFKLNMSVLEIVLYIISMMCVGFLEEVIFRGFLFKALCKKNIKYAILISSVTFGLGHIVNLLNGQNTLETLIQICYAVVIGFLFTIIFYKGKSLWPCIIAHSMINSLSVFANIDAITVKNEMLSAIFLCVVSLSYAIYILVKK